MALGGCRVEPGDGDSDGDVDSDADVDGDVDVDSDADTDADVDGCVPTNGGIEACDGFDNDCDSLNDEAESGGPLRRSCFTACGAGEEECEAGEWLYCTAPSPLEEVCDGLDNDCDGDVDEGCDCRHGERRECGIDQGVCEPGVETCEGGVWGECQLSYDPYELVEICADGLDNDCDGDVDEVDFEPD